MKENRKGVTPKEHTSNERTSRERFSSKSLQRNGLRGGTRNEFGSFCRVKGLDMIHDSLGIRTRLSP